MTRPTQEELEQRVASMVESLYDMERAGDVIMCLEMALTIVVTVAAQDKKDALGTVTAIAKSMKQAIDKNFNDTRRVWAEKFPHEEIRH